MVTDITRSRKVVLELEKLKKYFPVERGFFRKVVGHVKAVDDVSLTIHEGEALGLVGESGSGKTTLGRCVVRAIDVTEGAIHFNHEHTKVDLATTDSETLMSVRPSISMIFQDPFSSLDPRWTVLDIVGEPLRRMTSLSSAEIEEKVRNLMSVVGLEAEHLKRYPHAFSGGQRQRIGVARALATDPIMIVADEAVSALDVSIQAQILNLIKDLQAERNLALLFISHDLSVVEHVSDRVAVMYLGKVVEIAETNDLFLNPKHPYTASLLAAVPSIKRKRGDRKRTVVRGEIPDPANPPTGCHFHPRCQYAQDICMQSEPQLRQFSGNHVVSCHLADEIELKLVS